VRLRRIGHADDREDVVGEFCEVDGRVGVTAAGVPEPMGPMLSTGMKPISVGLSGGEMSNTRMPGAKVRSRPFSLSAGQAPK
jgi:hypothetical protein